MIRGTSNVGECEPYDTMNNTSIFSVCDMVKECYKNIWKLGIRYLFVECDTSKELDVMGNRIIAVQTQQGKMEYIHDTMF